MSPKVSIVMVNWNGLLDTVECIDSLSKCSYKNYDITVIDNGSCGDDAKVLQSKYRVSNSIRIIGNEKNLGFAGGVNIGIRLVIDSEYILLLDNDTIVDPEFLSELVKLMDNDKSVGISNALVYHYKTNKIQHVCGKTTNLWTEMILPVFRCIRYRKYDYSRIVDVAHATFWCSLFRSDVFKKVGLFDEKILRYEDVDFYIRANKIGIRSVYVPTSKVWHKSRGAGGNGGLQYFSTRSKFWIMKRYSPKWQYYLFLLYMFTVHFLMVFGYYLIIKRKMNAFTNFCRGVRDGIKEETLCVA